jgi:hypothetical protein
VTEPNRVIDQGFTSKAKEWRDILLDYAALAALASIDTNHHALAIDVVDLRTRYLGAPHPG